MAPKGIPEAAPRNAENVKKLTAMRQAGRMVVFSATPPQRASRFITGGFMERLRNLRLLDENGHPLNERIESALARLVPRFRKQFPMLRDEHDLTEVLEQAGRRIANREQHSGAIESLHGYAWVTLRNVATSCVRRGSGKLAQRTLDSHESQTALAQLPAATGTPDEIELAILVREVQTHLVSSQERLVLGWKKAGFSSEEIAQFRGTSIGAVDAVFSRAKHKIRTLLRVQQNGGGARKRLGHADRNVSRESSREANVERRDDHTTPRTGPLQLQVRR